MKALFIIITVANLYMFLFVVGRTDLGDGRPILAGAYFVLAVMWGLEFALDLRPKKDEQSRGEKLKEKLRSNGTRTKR